MKARVQRWGNSLALRIPQAFGRELNLRPESSVEMTVDSGRLILVPIADSGLSSPDSIWLMAGRYTRLVVIQIPLPSCVA